MSRSSANLSTSVLASIPSLSKEKDILYCCTVGIPLRMEEKKLNSHLAVPGEWCCTPNLRVGIYEAYLLGGFRLPLNAFTKEILHRLDIGINQLNHNAWRLIRREVFDGNRRLTMDEFLYCYKPSEISQSLGFYQFFYQKF